MASAYAFRNEGIVSTVVVVWGSSAELGAASGEERGGTVD